MIKDVIIHKKELCGVRESAHNLVDRNPVRGWRYRKLDLSTKEQQESWNALERLRADRPERYRAGPASR
jgi:hypothetical protein